MKSKILKSLLAIACLLGSNRVSAYDFEVDGIYYDVVSLSDFTCSVTSGDTKYEGDIVIPATVNYSNRTLTVVEVGNSAFSGCSNLTSITIPNTITSVGNNAFNGCTKLKHVVIEDGETVLNLGHNYYERGLFYDCPIRSVYLGRDLSYNSSQYYGLFPFYKKTELTELTIGNSVTTIGYSAFRECSGLTSVTIPNSVTTIGYCAFQNCNGLTTLYTLNTTPPSVDSSNFTNNQYMTLSVYVPQEALEAYQSADTWKNFWNLQGFDATGIGSVKPTNENGKAVYYDLNGRRLNAPRHGLNIVNGKKVMVQ